jgi:ribose 5-phosphate isomerase A
MDQREQNQWKQAAAEAAAGLVEDGMVVGLGSGSTAAFFVAALARRISLEGLRVSGLATSRETADQARGLGITLTSFSEQAQIDIVVDGADEIETGTLYLIKGRGGALLREKIVAAASRRMAVIADETKLVGRLGSIVSVPVEVVQFGWQATERRLGQLGGNPSLRVGRGSQPYVTDGGNFIVDCAFGVMENPEEVAHHLDQVVGAVEHGLFLGFTWQVFVGGREGVRILKRKADD